MASKKLSKACINLVKEHEGYHKKRPDGSCTTYYCPAGVLTIGYGCTVGIKEGDIWSPAQAVEALKRELAKHEQAINSLVKVDISQNAFDALVSFSYNVGSGALSKSTLLKKLNKGDMQGAAAEFAKWNKGGGKVLPGLVRRRAQEAELFLTPDNSIAPVMPQEVDIPAPPIASAMQSSRTIFGLLTAFGASLVGWFKDAVDQITLFEPAKQIGTGLGLNLTTIVFAITAAGLALALFARLDDARKGNVK